MSVQYREVKRKASVGERIKVVSAKITFGDYENGDVFTVKSRHRDRGIIPAEVNEAAFGYICDEEYIVLEPVEFADSTEPTTDHVADLERKVDGLTDTVARLTTAMQRMNIQLRVAREDIVLIEEGVAEDIAELRTKLAELEREQSGASGPVNTGLPPFVREGTTLAAESVRKQTLTRDASREAIIERAKRDVTELLSLNHPGTGGEGAWFTNSDGSVITDRCEFIINRDKRTVLALLRYVSGNRVWARGIAKCAPDDVFNTHIGRAISLRRALGLAVPDEYVNAPKPTEARVGDYVYYTSTFPRVLVTDGNTDASISPPRACIDFIRMTATEASPNPVIDDSREEVPAE